MPRRSASPHPLKRWETWAVLASIVAIVIATVLMVHLFTTSSPPSRPETLGQRIADLVLLVLWP